MSPPAPLGPGESVQVRARLDAVLAAGLVAFVAASDMSRFEVMRAAVAEYLVRHRRDDEPTAGPEEPEVERSLNELRPAVVDDPAGPARDLREVGGPWGDWSLPRTASTRSSPTPGTAVADGPDRPGPWDLNSGRSRPLR